ncbi:MULTISPECIES: hypothetical protein [Enterobacterales]|jgi:hypothetical protein|uniref:Uncharacterized protein n=5 Tax=Enterobacteriaceae TaxID=543 RepID=A0AAW9BY05_KLUCR|nr:MULTISPECIES: hypothetical protein [Enterobacterales]EFE7904375.1 hypothetical protein [Escherichia coli]MCF6689964.1 hypothetical protein [Raoultella terrigena]EFM2408847.1 hypothetical protein [Escherichia coli]EIX9053529.1 hypothetical protein [Klebsiella oxytoca]EKW4788430.1 hypothetical protein [Klebsiella variicola]
MKNEQQSENNGCLVLPLTHSNRGLDSLSLEQIAALPDAPASGAGRKSNLSFLPFIASLNGVRFADLDVEQAHRFTALRDIAGTIGLVLVAEVHSGPDNAVVQTPEGMNDKQLVDWYVENNAMISVSRFVKDSPW